MLEGFVEPQLRRLGIDPTALHFQQDGATAQTARKCSELLSLVSATSLGLLGRPTLLYQIFPVGVPERPCVPEAYRNYSRTQTSHC